MKCYNNITFIVYGMKPDVLVYELWPLCNASIIDRLLHALLSVGLKMLCV